MKKWTSLALLGLTSATLLVACGSKKEENSSSVKETQTSMKSGQNKTNQSSKKKNTKATESSSEETTQSSQTTTASNTTSGDKATDSSQMVPAATVIWTSFAISVVPVQVPTSSAGTVTTTANFYQADVNPIRTATTRAKAVQASGNIYYWETDEPGAFDALLPGIAGLGGANAKVKAGFILEEGHYTPIVFVTGLNEDFDYSKYNDFRVSLTK